MKKFKMVLIILLIAINSIIIKYIIEKLVNTSSYAEKQIAFFTKGSYYMDDIKKSMDLYKDFDIERCLLCISVDNNFDQNSPDINGITDEEIEDLIRYAEYEMGWKVTLKMHNAGEYDGDGNQKSPRNSKIWFENYNILVQRISNIAKVFKHEYFIISNEMNNVSNIYENKIYWEKIINEVKEKNLKVGSSVNMPEIFDNDGYQLWDELDFYGINLYPRLTDKDKEWGKNNLEDLKNGFYNDLEGRNFEYILNTLKESGKEVWITEFGCVPNENGLSAPAYWGGDLNIDEEVQTVYLEVMFSILRQLKSVDVMTLWVGNYDDLFSLLGKDAESVLWKYWGKPRAIIRNILLK